MHRSRSAGVLALAGSVLALSPAAGAAQFAASAPQYTMGNVYTASGAVYASPLAALGSPAPIVGATTAFAGVLSPFNPHYETNQLVAIGRGGSITLGFASPVPVTAEREIGVFTSASFIDADYPNGTAPTPAQSAASVEYGARRTAVVEVAGPAGGFVSLGRVVFDTPTNYYASASSPYQYPAPANAVVADFAKPFTADLSSLAGHSFSQLLQTLDGSAGGTWIDVPQSLGLAQIQTLRLSDPLWLLPDGTTVQTRTSIYDPTFVKPADLFIDAVSAVPEPSGIVLIALCGLMSIRRRSHP
jgi:hypothetical protein